MEKQNHLKLNTNKRQKFSSVYGQSKFNSSKYLIEKFRDLIFHQ